MIISPMLIAHIQSKRFFSVRWIIVRSVTWFIFKHWIRLYSCFLWFWLIFLFFEVVFLPLNYLTDRYLNQINYVSPSNSLRSFTPLMTTATTEADVDAVESQFGVLTLTKYEAPVITTVFGPSVALQPFFKAVGCSKKVGWNCICRILYIVYFVASSSFTYGYHLCHILVYLTGCSVQCGRSSFVDKRLCPREGATERRSCTVGSSVTWLLLC